MNFKISFKHIFIALLCCTCISTICYISYGLNGIGNDNVDSKVCDVFKSNSSSVFRIPLQKNKTTDFQPVSNGTDMYVYAAYYEGGDKIRLIGLSFNIRKPVLCLLRYWNTSAETETVRVVKAYVASIHKWERDRYTSVYFLCYLCGFELPAAVSITTDINNISNIIPVQKVPRISYPQRTFTMCVSPMYGTIGDLVFIEWIELHRILGVQKFIIYVKVADEKIHEILKYYVSKGVVDMFPWLTSDSINSTLVMNMAQMAALNDCLYKTKGHSRYIAATDVDEFIIPQFDEDYTWMDMMQRMPNENVFMFRNSFFRRQHHFQEENKPLSGRLVIESLRFRETLVYKPMYRSKLIGWTDDIVTLDVHEINALRKGYYYVVPVDIGLLHHYRRSLGGLYSLNNAPTIVNSTSVLKYIKPLRERVEYLSNIFNIYYD